jgi:hypothetical protein
MFKRRPKIPHPLKQTILRPSSPQRLRPVLGLVPVGDLTGVAGADTMGALMGTSLVGAALAGALVGPLSGALVGLLVGVRVGALVGFLVGVRVGNGVGFLVGVRVGTLVGVRVGTLVGVRVGALVGAFVGVLVGHRYELSLPGVPLSPPLTQSRNAVEVFQFATS